MLHAEECGAGPELVQSEIHLCRDPSRHRLSGYRSGLKPPLLYRFDCLFV